MMRPSVPLPTGTEIGPPVAVTFMPRRRPSEEPRAMQRTTPSPSCCSTSKVRSSCSTSGLLRVLDQQEGVVDARHALAFVLAGGRGSRLHGADRPARQAGGLFRRQVAHHRFRAVERAQLRHPPHRGRDPVQGAQPDPSPAARLELLPPRAQRELRHPARQPARLGDACGMSAPPTRSTRTSTSSRATAPNTSSCWPATTSTRWTTS